MTETIDFAGDQNIGVFTRVLDTIAVAPPDSPESYIRAIEDTLNVEVLLTTIQGSSIIGSLLVGNNRGLIVSGLATAEEIAVLEGYADVMLLESTMNAAGNIILTNDDVAVLHPRIPNKTAEAIGEFLDVDILLMSIGGIRTTGMAGVATSRGILLHPRASVQEIEEVEKYTEVPVGTGSVNMGSGLVGAGLLANRHGYLAGISTSGFELGRIDEVFRFGE